MSNLLNKTIRFLPQKLRGDIPKKIAVVEISSHQSRRLNLIYRGKNKPTNVLSFYYGPDYGEILICPEIVKKEAKEQGNTQAFQMTWMIAHGMIHLAGIHHDSSKVAAGRVDILEKQILHRFF